ncbi:MAG: ACP S-malonyltransferase [Novosphingobium sp.]
MKTAVVVCPGRGTYNKTELGYLGRHFQDRALLQQFDAIRGHCGQETLSALDGAERFSVNLHTRGDNASALIYAATIGDFAEIDFGKVNVVAITGNSMGWYSALACGGAIGPVAGFQLANTMGTLMQTSLIGGQLIHPFVGEDWMPNSARRAELLELVRSINDRAGHVLDLSIDLGGMLVLAGNEAGLKAFEAAVEPEQGRYPMRLPNHAAFHTHLQEPVAEAGREAIDPGTFGQPTRPLIDGRGKIWWPGSTDSARLYEYTLGDQVTTAYDYTRAIIVAAREFAPDLFIITGPGGTLGGATAQALIMANWRGLGSREDFRDRQVNDPLLVSMGFEDQRAKVTA